MRAALGTALSAILFIGLSGCKKDGDGPSSGNQKEDQRILQELGLTLHTYHDGANRFPNSKEELEKALAVLGAKPDVQEAVKSGKVVVVYGGLSVPQIGGMSGTDNTVIAYASYVPEKGGPILLCDASTKIVTADEFKKMPQAKK
jgi:hypothetical protein